jgi:hypothetical protein
MGGIGSGHSGRDRVDSCRFLDVNQLHKAGCLRPGLRGARQWDGQKVAWVNLRARVDGLDMSTACALAAAHERM